MNNKLTHPATVRPRVRPWETHIVNTPLQMRLPVSGLLRNLQKQNSLERHE